MSVAASITGIWARIREFAFRARSLLLRQAVESRMDEEMRFHLDKLVEHFEMRGIAHDEAVRLAHVEFGGIARQRDAVRDTVRLAVLEQFARDVRIGTRFLLRTPVVTLATIATVAVGIGGTTALFGLVDRLVLRSLTVPRPEELYSVFRTRPNSVSESVPYPVFRDLSGARSLEHVSGYAFRTAVVDHETDSAIVQLTSANWFATVDARPVIGRAWDSTEVNDAPAVISDALWARQFGRSSNAIGSRLALDGHVFTVAGVMRPGFTGVSLDFPVDVWVPIETQPWFDQASLLTDPDRNWVRMIVRLDGTEGAAHAEAVANLAVAQMRAARTTGIDSTERLQLVGASQPITRNRAQLARTLYAALALAALVLFIACANVANLQVARAAGRRREIAVRLALGASRSRLVRQLLTESLVLAALGGAFGLWLALLAARALSSFAQTVGLGPTIGSLAGGLINGHTLCFTALMTLASALVFGLSPALRSSRVDVAPELRQTGLVQRARGRRRGVNALLVGQLAFSVVLLVSALEVAATLRAALSVDLGFSSRGVYQVSVDWRAMPDAAAGADADVIASTLRATPGIQAASVSYPAAFGRPTASTSAFVDGRGPARGAPGTVEYQTVGPEFFLTLGMAIVNGRPFAPSDREGAEPVVILNERAARELFPGGHPVGQRFGLFGPQHRVTVIGIAHDMRLHSPTAPAPAVAYVPLAQNSVAVPPGSLMIEVHAAASAVAASDISRAIAGVDPRLKVEVQPLAALVAQSLAAERLSAWATAAFGALGVILAMMGVYGLHAYVVSRRTTELGIRLALGAPRGRVLWGIWKDGMRPVAIGSALGLWLAVLAAAVLRHSVAGLSAADAEVALIAAVTLASIAGAACYIPARAAARLDPARALRAD